MQYVCDAPKGKTWFRIETEGEAAHEVAPDAPHSREIFLPRAGEGSPILASGAAQRDRARHRPRGPCTAEMPLFLTLRDREGNALATAMLPPGGKDRGGFRIIIVAASNADPYPEQDAAIAALGAHFGLTLDRHRCFPYGR